RIREALRLLCNSMRPAALSGNARVVTLASPLPDSSVRDLASAVSKTLVDMLLRVLVIDGGVIGGKREAAVPIEQLCRNEESAGLVMKEVHRGRLLIVQAAGDSTAGLLSTSNLAAIRTLLIEARRTFDVVIIEAPSVLLFAGCLELSSMSDATYLVVRWGRTRRADVRLALQRLREVATTEIGVVLTDAETAHQQLENHEQLHSLIKSWSFYRRWIYAAARTLRSRMLSKNGYFRSIQRLLGRPTPYPPKYR